MAPGEWEIDMDLKDNGRYPDLIRESGMWPHSALHSRKTKQVVLLELTVPWGESKCEEHHVFKLAKYEETVAGVRRYGHPTRLLALEVDVVRSPFRYTMH